MKTKLKLGLKITALLLVCIFPVVTVFSVAFLSSPEFDESFVGALDEKLERLAEIDEDKLVIIGGSSAAFGYDSAIIEKYLDMPVVNLGLYAALGTKLMLDLSKDSICEGDIVVIAPELDAQTLSLYFSASTTLRALDGSPKYLSRIPKEHRVSLLGASWSFAAEKLSYKLFGGAEYDGVYSAKSFNDYGDIGVYRAANTMHQYYDPNLPILLDGSIIDGDFVDYLNDYIAYVKSVGATVYFEFCPMNRLAISEETSSYEAMSAFQELVENTFDCEVVGYVEDYIYDEGYFYDSNFHLNSAGVVKHTVNVTRDLLIALGVPSAVNEEIPDPPALPELDLRYFEEDENSKYFEYEKMANGAYMIVGVKEQYRNEKTLTVPLGYNGYKVMVIGPSAFSDSSVERLILTEDTSVRQFANGAFLGAGSLSEMYIYYPEESDISPPLDFIGTKADFKVYVPLGSNYMSGYFWSERNLTFEYIFD